MCNECWKDMFHVLPSFLLFHGFLFLLSNDLFLTSRATKSGYFYKQGDGYGTQGRKRYRTECSYDLHSFLHYEMNKTKRASSHGTCFFEKNMTQKRKKE